MTKFGKKLIAAVKENRLTPCQGLKQLLDFFNENRMENTNLDEALIAINFGLGDCSKYD